MSTDPSALSNLLSNFWARTFHFLHVAIGVGSTWLHCQPDPPCLDTEHLLQTYNQQMKVGTSRLQPNLS